MPEPTWNTVTTHLRDLAALDIARDGQVRPTLLAFDRDEFLGGIELRSAPDHDRDSPLIEAIALAVPLGADRLAFLAGGRAWSLDDPIPPVSEDADLRQPIAIVLRVERRRNGEARTHSTLLPYARDPAGTVAFHDEQLLDDGGGEGWIARYLEVAVTHCGELGGDDPLDVGRQAVRLVRLGHGLLVPSAPRDPRLAAAVLAALESEERGDPQPSWVLSHLATPGGPVTEPR